VATPPVVKTTHGLHDRHIAAEVKTHNRDRKKVET